MSPDHYEYQHNPTMTSNKVEILMDIYIESDATLINNKLTICAVAENMLQDQVKQQHQP